MQVYLSGISWRTATHVGFTTAIFDNYQIGTEPKQTVSRTPGSSAAKAIVSLCKFKNAVGWNNTAFSASDITLTIINGHGISTDLSPISPAVSAHLEFLHLNWLSSQSFEMWDDR